jgi:hypothetical protein
MYRFRASDIFQVNRDLSCQVHSLANGAGRYLVVDGFYADPLSVRRLLLTTPYPAWERDISGTNLVDYSDCRQTFHLPFEAPQQAIRELAGRALEVRLPVIRAGFVTNLFRNHNEPPATAQPRPHDDGPCLAAVVMLNLPEECVGGTAFYQSRTPALPCMPQAPEDYQAARGEIYTGPRQESGAGYFLDHWADHWERVATVDMRFNRLLVYPGLMFHGHWHLPGSFVEHWRVNQALFFDNPEFSGADG